MNKYEWMQTMYANDAVVEPSCLLVFVRIRLLRLDPVLYSILVILLVHDQIEAAF